MPDAPDADADALEREVLARISPTPAELERMDRVRERLVSRAEQAARERESTLVRALVAGSAARGTFVRERVDVDLFLLFPPQTPRQELEAEGLAIARVVLPDGETRYAEHPYLRGKFEEFTVDAVPGYAVVDASRPQSAVDRTPFHQEYLQQRQTPAIVGQVILTKQFLRGLGVYGADARTGGFSGYLIELLVLRFLSLRALLFAARDWRIPVDLRTSPQANPRVPDDVALILEDPVDPHRNVASALTRRNLGLFIVAAAEYLARPTREAFDVEGPPSMSRERGMNRMRERGTHVSVLTLNRPDLVDDILYPQLRKAERAFGREAERLGFHVLGSASAAGPDSVTILLEVESNRLPAVRIQRGPPPGVDRVGDFLKKWIQPEAPVLQGPYIAGDGRLAVEVREGERRLEALVNPILVHLPLGKDLRVRIDPSTQLHELANAPESEGLSLALTELFDKQLPWLRRRSVHG
jgi:tRNA nucleotidyltransferase (CCA-adding enzyme)